MLNLRVCGSVSAEVKKRVVDELLRLEAPRLFTEHRAGHEEEFYETFRLCLVLPSVRLRPNPYCRGGEAEPYDCRFVWCEESTVREVVAEVTSLLTGRRFVSTRGAVDLSVSFLTVVREGLGSDGGLFVLRDIPRITVSQLKFLCTAPELSYVEVAQSVLERLIDMSLTPDVLYKELLGAYDPSCWSRLEDVCPLTPVDANLTSVGEEGVSTIPSDFLNMYLLELYHGPTAAFKDFALQLFPRYFDAAVKESKNKASRGIDRANAISSCSDEGRLQRYMILTATSGDTGVAAISGFVNAVSPCRVMVLYPLHGVSAVQKMHMLSYDNGTSVRVIGVESDFDFCQNSVKKLFADKELGSDLLRSSGVALSSANSINWGRLIPQVVYYFWAYRKCLQCHGNNTAKCMVFGDKVDFAVPSGNFGNILAAYMAKRMGLPIGKLIVASNSNNVLHDFVSSGCYDINDRHLTPTASPSIDILRASNVERFLFLLSDGDAKYVSERMEQLDTHKRFDVHGNVLKEMKNSFFSSSCDEPSCAATIRRTFETTGRVLDPHTAVAMHAALLYRRQHPCGAQRPLVVVSTAHWAKFPEAVLTAIHSADSASIEGTEPMTDPVGSCMRLYERMLRLCPGEAVHPMLNSVLNDAGARKDSLKARTAPPDVDILRKEVVNFCSLRA